MAIYPSIPKPARMKPSLHSPTIVHTPHNPLAQKRHSRGAQYIAFELTYSKLRRRDYAELAAFLAEQDGRLRSFTFVPPILGTGRGDLSGSVPVVDGADQAGTSVDIRGLAASTQVFRKLDLVQFAGHFKTYIVTRDVTSDGDGKATLTIRPPLLEAPADGEAVRYEDIEVTVVSVSDSVSLDIQPPDRSPLTVGLVEVKE